MVEGGACDGVVAVEGVLVGNGVVTLEGVVDRGVVTVEKNTRVFYYNIQYIMNIFICAKYTKLAYRQLAHLAHR